MVCSFCCLPRLRYARHWRDVSPPIVAGRCVFTWCQTRNGFCVSVCSATSSSINCLAGRLHSAIPFLFLDIRLLPGAARGAGNLPARQRKPECDRKSPVRRRAGDDHHTDVARDIGVRHVFADTHLGRAFAFSLVAESRHPFARVHPFTESRCHVGRS